MKKYSLFTLLLILITATLLSQQITPALTTEQCPGVNITFTVTIPAKSIQSVQPKALNVNPTVVLQPMNVVVNGANITFDFVGKFADNNNKQTFTVNYTNSNDLAATFDFPFIKIKSLLTPNSFSQVSSTPANFIAPLCQNTMRTISFPNVQYGNPFENPAIGYGSITNYEYLLPAGWKFDNYTSDGVTWFSGINSANITSDFTSGAANAFIQVRPVNSACGAGLAKNNISYIPILRPAPSLSMSGAQTLCFPNGYNFTVSGVPANSSITWPVNSYYSSAPSGYSAIISPTSSANAATNVKATITPSGCSLSFDVQKLVSIGAPYVTFNINSYPYEEPNCYEVWGIYSFQAQQLTGYPNTFTSLQWGWRNLTLSTSYTDPTIYGTQYSFIPYDAGTYELWTKAVNECGISTLESVKTITVYEACGRGLLMNETSLNIYPNPSKGNIKIQVPEEFRSSSIVNVSNQYGTSFIQRRLVNTGDNIDLDLRSLNKGIYQITLSNGKKVIQGKLIRQ